MLRIAMLSYHTCPIATLGGKDTGGMNVYVRELTRQLGRVGVHVDVFTRSQDEHVPHVLHDLGYGNRVVHVPAGPEVPLAKRDLADHIPQFVEGIKLFAAEKNIQYDLIHSHYWMSGLAAESLSVAWGIPFVHMFHTLGEMKNRIARNEQEREGAYRVDGEKRVIASADRLIAATRAEQTQLQFLYKANKRKIEIIPPGVDLSHFYPIPSDEARQFIGIKPDARIVLFVGRIEPLKGIDTLIQAMSCMKFRQVMDHVHLAIIGGDPGVSKEQMSAEMTRLQSLCDELCMEHMVVFLGKRAQETLPYYYSAAEVLVMPSHYESFGMVALEAMACGTPVIASQVGGLAYLVQDGVTGYHVPDHDPEALCAKLLEVLGDQAQRKRMGQQAAEFAQEYAWSNIADQLIKVYQTVLEERSRVAPRAHVR
jgi:D-inositol-3-phosphate glycosyltransferase